MDIWFSNILVTFCISLSLTGILIPQILRIALKRKLYDQTDGRKIHRGAVPRLGGIAFMPAVVFSCAFTVAMNLNFTPGQQMAVSLMEVTVPVTFGICSMMLLFLVGITDDLIGVRYRAKFLVQILCAVLTVISGTWIYDMHGLLWIGRMPEWAGYLVTGFLVVYVVNAVNLIDGIDGLASGLCIVALMFYGWLLALEGCWFYSMVAWATCGSLIPFFYYNVFGNEGHGKKIFMGDTGSLTIGMIVVFLSIATVNAPREGELTEFNPMVLAFSPLVVPLFDVIRVTIHRIKRHSNPFLPDRSHIHHKFLALGFGQGEALMVILAISIAFTTLNVVLSPALDVNIIVAIDVVIWTVGNIILTHAIRRREHRLGKRLYE